MKILVTVFILVLSLGLFAQSSYSLEEINELKKVYYDKEFSGNKASVISLSISNSEVLPTDLLEYKNLRKISFFLCSDLDLQTALPELLNLKNLIALEILVNNGNKLPDLLFDFKNLKSLAISGMSLKKISNKISNLNLLEELILGHPFSGGCGLKELPKSIEKLEYLTSLRLWGNGDLQIDDWFYSLEQLEKLELIHIDHSTSKLFGNLSNLKELEFGDNVTDLDGIENLTKLSKLFLWYNQGLIDIGDNFQKLDSLQHLRLYVNKRFNTDSALTQISKLKNLEALVLEIDKEVTHTPKFPISGFNQLEELRLNTDGLSGLDSILVGIKNYKNLKKLTIAGFDEKSLPDALFQLTNLQLLELQNMEIGSIPNDIGDLNIESLKVWNIPITSLPKGLLNSDHIEYVYLGRTKIENVDPVLIKLKNQGVEIEGIKW